MHVFLHASRKAAAHALQGGHSAEFITIQWATSALMQAYAC
jgi:hypothetical protein